MTLKHPNLNNC